VYFTEIRSTATTGWRNCKAAIELSFEPNTLRRH
jgi:hypothetical protein